MNFLSIYWDADPIIFSIGSFAIRWYSLAWILTFGLGTLLMMKFYKREKLSMDLIDPLFYSMLIGVFIGARLGHCFFYEPDYYLAQPLEILKVWKGGLSSHGGAVGILLALWWYVRKYGKKNDIDYFWILDRICILVALAGLWIRTGNLMNSEIYGNPTDLPWGFIFARHGETVPKHPTQIYEALSYFSIFLIMIFLYMKKLPQLKRGFLFGFFMTTCFSARILIEFIKEPQVEEEIGMVLNIGQLLSIPFVIAGIIIMIWSIRHGKPAANIHSGIK